METPIVTPLLQGLEVDVISYLKKDSERFMERANQYSQFKQEDLKEIEESIRTSYDQVRDLESTVRVLESPQHKTHLEAVRILNQRIEEERRTKIEFERRKKQAEEAKKSLEERLTLTLVLNTLSERKDEKSPRGLVVLMPLGNEKLVGGLQERLYKSIIDVSGNYGLVVYSGKVLGVKTNLKNIGRIKKRVLDLNQDSEFLEANVGFYLPLELSSQFFSGEVKEESLKPDFTKNEPSQLEQINPEAEKQADERQYRVTDVQSVTGECHSTASQRISNYLHTKGIKTKKGSPIILTKKQFDELVLKKAHIPIEVRNEINDYVASGKVNTDNYERERDDLVNLYDDLYNPKVLIKQISLAFARHQRLNKGGES
ncbi:MAG: hypothetical protein ABIG37_02315 [Nanoarchaeota archaeon]